jgi:hypothetical protein
MTFTAFLHAFKRFIIEISLPPRMQNSGTKTLIFVVFLKRCIKSVSQALKSPTAPPIFRLSAAKKDAKQTQCKIKM